MHAPRRCPQPRSLALLAHNSMGAAAYVRSQLRLALRSATRGDNVNLAMLVVTFSESLWTNLLTLCGFCS